MNRKSSIIGIVAIILFAFIAISEVNWITDFEIAKTKAVSDNKLILMNFSGSDWCGNCMRLDKTVFQSDDFIKYAESNLITLQLDFPSKKKNKLSEEQTTHNEKLADKYNPKGIFPKVLLLDSSGEIVGNLTTHVNSAKTFISEIEKLKSQ